MSKLSFIPKINSVRIQRDNGQIIFVSSKETNFVWKDNKGNKGLGEGYLGLHALCDSVGDLSLEEFNYLKLKGV